MIQPQHQAEAAAQRRAHQALPRGRADRRELLQRHRMRARAGPRADQDVEMEILQRRVEHLLHIGQQPMNFVDEENLARLNRAENAGEIELLLQHRAGGLLECHFQFLRDDRRERGFAQSGRAVEQHVIHRLAALAGGFDGDLQIFFEPLLAGEIGEAPRTQAGFELQFVVIPACRNQPLCHVLLYHCATV